MERREFKVEAPEMRLDPEITAGLIDWAEVFGASGPVEVEIGIGKGRFLLAVAAARPEVSHLGVEWANKYVRIAETRALKRGLKNVRFARVDARDLVCHAIPSGSVSAYYVFYPDPWPKKRHHKRRFLQTETADHLARTLKTAGLLHVATDHASYWQVIEPLFDSHREFERLSEFGGPEFPIPVDGLMTNFEEKYFKEGRRRYRATWTKKSL
jgi:tRNA (guanine-N7-)-methyltransferase